MKYEGLEEIMHGLILNRWYKNAKDCRSTPVESKDSHEGRLLRYGALCGAMSLVAQLGAEDAAEFVVARDGIASLIEVLQQRLHERVGSQLGLSSLFGIKDPVVSKTKRAPRKGNESEPGEGVAVADGAGGPSSVECCPHDATAPSATPKTRYCHTNEGFQSETGNPCETDRTRADGNTPSIAHGSSNPFCRNPLGVRGGGTNFFLGGQHIEQFYASHSCSGHIGEPSAHAASTSFHNPNTWTNEDLFERWLTQNVLSRSTCSGKHGSIPKQ
ncbi:hypothetical protein AHAS_Ahas03G0145000 [Arachis hypogaea]